MTVRTARRIMFASLVALGVLGLAPTPEARIEVTIREGTNMAAALSPDGRTIAMDALGRIWTLPAGGGEARALTDPLGDARQPTWSPDGGRIAFQAYWNGDYDIWAVGADGSGLEQITGGAFDDREPHWSPDGRRIAFASDRGGTYDVWEVELATGEVRRLTEGAENEYQPAYAPDGRRIAYVADGDASGVWVREGSGATARIVNLEGQDGYAPSWSPDGSRIAYDQQVYGASRLRVVPAAGSGDHGAPVSEDGEDVFGFRASWRADGSLLYTADGRLRVRPAAGGRASDVPFTATVTLDRPTYRKRLRDFGPSGPLPVKGIVSPAVSPDGSRVAFTALGDLWVVPTGGGEPERITDDVWVEADPMWSPDGTRLAYGSDRAGEGRVDIWVHDVGTGHARQLTEGGGSGPVWSPDGTQIAYTGGGFQDGGLRVVSVETGAVRTVRSGLFGPSRPTWSPDGRQLAVSAHWRYSTRFREGVNKALLIPVPRVAAEDEDAGFDGDGGVPPEPALQAGERWLDFLAHASVGNRGTDGPIWSPDGRWMAYVSAGVLWAVPVTPSGDPVGPPRRLTNESSADPTWTGDSRSIVFLGAEGLRRVWLQSGRIDSVPVEFTWQRSVPQERYTIHAGALFDGVSEALRRNVDVVVEGNRIVRVADHDASLHSGRVVDASNGVLSPGLIEMHTHGGLEEGEEGGRVWLSYGVTSIRRVAADPYDMTEAKEAIESGRRVGPRIFGTGNTVDGSRIYYPGAPSLSSTAQVELELQQAGRLGYDLVKTYVRLPDAVQARVIADAHALGLPLSSHELYPAVAYGMDGVEHVRGTSRRGYSTKVSELYRSYQDVEELLVRSGMAITPTVGLYGGFGLIAQDDPTLLDDPRVRAFSPSTGRGGARGDPEVARRMVSDMADIARRVVERGGVVVAGTDYGPSGLTLHVELDVLVRYGGMRPVDALRAATSAAAEHMGYGQDLGRVAPGMLADLVVFGASPLDDVSATRDTRLVVADGRVYRMEELLARPDAD